MISYTSRNHAMEHQLSMMPDVSALLTDLSGVTDLQHRMAYQFLSFLNPEEDSNRDFQAYQLVGQMQAFITEHYKSPISNDVYEELFGYNKKYLSKVFKEETGMSPVQYHTFIRIEKAKEILRKDQNILIHDLALLIGYDDAYYFSRVFKNVSGMSPSHFVRTLSKFSGE